MIESNDNMIIYGSILVSAFAILYAFYLSVKLRSKKRGTPKAKKISDYIYKGALTYLKKQYSILSVFVIITAVILFMLNHNIAVAFVFGAFLSGLSGNIGMRVSTMANGRAAHACMESQTAGLKVAFSSGAVMGLMVVGFGIIGISILYIIFGDPSILFGFGFGASSIALFARVGGGIYTKAADVGADIVGKVEKGIPEDDPRNPAVIADLVGDNVGDVAGMGADLFESYSDSLIAAMMLGVGLSFAYSITLPLVLASLGVLSSIIGILSVKLLGKQSSPSRALNIGTFLSAGLMFILSYAAIYFLDVDVGFWYATVTGLVTGIIIGIATELYTSYDYKPVKDIVNASRSGAATNIISGLALGMMSTFVPVIVICIAIYLAYMFAGLYGIALAAVGMLSTLGMTLATDTYGPVADNAEGIAEMAGYPKEVKARAESLDAVGNTTAAIGKGFAIGSAALTAVALFAAYSQAAGISVINLINPNVVIGLFIGGLLPFIFSSFALNAVGNAANKMVNEVRRQFKMSKGIMEGKVEPDYDKCIAISTHAALKQMIIPGVIAIITPIIIWFLLGPESLGGVLAGSIATGFLLAVFMANSGGAWDNAKKFIEKGGLGRGQGKGSDVHKATVIGDTVGDPFKDTAGPSLNILIKLMSIIALILAMTL